MDLLVLQTNRAASHRSGSIRQSKPVVRAVGGSVLSWLYAVSTNLLRSSASVRFHPTASVSPSPPTSHAPGSDQSLCICSSANSRLASSLPPPNDCFPSVHDAWTPIPLPPSYGT